MAYRAYATGALHNVGHFVKRAPFAELFESSELRYMKIGGGNLSLIVSLKSDFGVSFNPCDWIDRDRFSHIPSLGSKTRESGNVWDTAGEQFGKYGINCVGGRRAAGHVHAHRKHFVDGSTT